MAFSRQIVSVVAAGMLAVHVVVGCCAHHGHAQSSENGAALREASPHHDHGCRHACSHHSKNKPAAPSDDDGQPSDHACGKGSCSFLAGSKLMLPDLTPPAGVFDCQGDVLPSRLAHGSAAEYQFLAQSSAPPLRSHLSKGVLLI